jgi:hypothetical protein
MSDKTRQLQCKSTKIKIGDNDKEKWNGNTNCRSDKTMPLQCDSMKIKIVVSVLFPPILCHLHPSSWAQPPLHPKPKASFGSQSLATLDSALTFRGLCDFWGRSGGHGWICRAWGMLMSCIQGCPCWLQQKLLLGMSSWEEEANHRSLLFGQHLKEFTLRAL